MISRITAATILIKLGIEIIRLFFYIIFTTITDLQAGGAADKSLVRNTCKQCFIYSVHSVKPL